MRGYPKHLNTRADADFVVKHFAADKWLPEFKAMLASYKDWFNVQFLESKEDGVTDETHRVINDGSEEKPLWIQQEYRIAPKAKIFRLGFTVEEVEAIVAKAGNADA